MAHPVPQSHAHPHSHHGVHVGVHSGYHAPRHAEAAPDAVTETAGADGGAGSVTASHPAASTSAGGSGGGGGDPGTHHASAATTSHAAPAPAASSRVFDADALVTHWAACRGHLGDVPIRDFVAGCDEVKKIVYTLGGAFTLASNDLTEKAGVLAARLVELEAMARDRGVEPLASSDTAAAPAAVAGPAAAAPAAGAGVSGTGTAASTTSTAPAPAAAPPGPRTTADAAYGPVRLSLQWMVLWEMSQRKEKMNSPGTYVSGARSLLRLLWFLDFLHSLIGQLLEDRKELRECAQVAYDAALAPHHPWILRKTIGGAIYFLPYKATFWTNLAGTVDPAVIRPKLQRFLDLMTPVRDELWRFYREHKLTELP